METALHWALSSANVQSRGSGAHSREGREAGLEAAGEGQSWGSRSGLSAKCLPSTPSQLTYKVASTAGAPSTRIQWSSCGHWDVSLPSPQGAWHGEGGPVWEEGRRGALCLGIGEGPGLQRAEFLGWK